MTEQFKQPTKKETQIIFVLYALIVMGAILIRFWRLTDIVYSLWLDEAWFGVRAAMLVAGESWIPLQIANEIGVGDSLFQIYATAAIQVLGGSQSFSSRYASAVMGSLSVILTFPVIITLFSGAPLKTHRYRLALISTLIMSTLLTGIIHSRHGLQMAASVVFSQLFLICWLYLERTGRWPWLIASGVVLGLGMTTYEAFLAVPVFVIAYNTFKLIWPQIIQQTAGVLLIGLIVWSPLIWFYLNNPGIYFSHASTTVGFEIETPSAGERLVNLVRTGLIGTGRVWGGISFVGDRLPGRNLPERPLFGPILSLFFWLGLASQFYQYRRNRSVQLIAIWLLALTIPSALSLGAPAFSRMLPMMPMLAGLAAVGIIQLLITLYSFAPKATWPTAGMIAIALLVVSANSISLYFNQWATNLLLFDTFRTGDRLALEEALYQESLGKTVLLITERNPFLKYPTQTLLIDNESDITVFHPDPACVPYPHNRLDDVVFVFIDDLEQTIRPILENAYPDAALLVSETPIIHPTFGNPHADFLEIPAHLSAPAPQNVFSVSFAEGIELVGYDLDRQADGLHITLHWAGNGPLAPAVSYFIHVAQGDNSDPFIGNINGELCPGYLPWRWESGYHFIQPLFVPLPAEQPAGDFDIRLGLYDTITQARLGVTAADGRIDNDRVRLQALP